MISANWGKHAEIAACTLARRLTFDGADVKLLPAASRLKCRVDIIHEESCRKQDGKPLKDAGEHLLPHGPNHDNIADALIDDDDLVGICRIELEASASTHFERDEKRKRKGCEEWSEAAS